MDSSSIPEEYSNLPTKDDDVETLSLGSKHKGKRKAFNGTSEGSNPPKLEKKSTASSHPPKPSNTRFFVRDHFTRTEENKDKCKCNYCGKQMSCVTSSETSNLWSHKATCKEAKAWEDRKSQQVLEQEGKGIDCIVRLSKVSEDVFREACNEMLVLGELPLSFIESVAWKHFCKKVKFYNPHSRRTSTRDIAEMFHKRKEDLRNMFKSTKQRVSVTTDIWVNPITGASYMVVTAHYIDSSWFLRKLIIGFKNMSDHKGSTISAMFLECLDEWGIEKIFTVTVDNVTSNINALKTFEKEFKKVGNDAFVLGGKFMHMCCCAHILKLIVREGLTELSDNVSVIRNAVQYVRSSTNRLKAFELRVDSGKLSRGSLPMDIKTRWNSTYLMLTRTIKYKVTFDKMEAGDKPYNDYFLGI